MCGSRSPLISLLVRRVTPNGRVQLARAVHEMAMAVLFFLALLSPALVLAQDSTPSPSPAASPKTPEEVDLEQQIKLLTLKKQAEDLKKGIRDDQPAPTATPLEGKTTVDDNVFLEVEMVSYNAMSEAAEKIGEEIHHRLGHAKVIAIYNAKDVASWRFYTSMYPAFKGQIKTLEHAYNGLNISLPKSALTASAIADAQTSLEAGASALKAFVDLIAIFRTDTEIKGKAVTIDESALVAELFRSLRNKYQGSATLYYPAVFPPQLVDQDGKFIDSPTLTEIGKLFRLEAIAIEAIGNLTTLKEDLVKDKALTDEIDQNDQTIQDNNNELPKLNQKLKVLQRELRRTKPGTAKAARLEEQIKALQEEIKNRTDENDKLRKRNVKARKERTDVEAEVTIIAAKVVVVLPSGASAKPAEIQVKIDDLKALNDKFDKFTAGFVTINETTGINPLTLFIRAENLEKALEECLPKPGQNKSGQNKSGQDQEEKSQNADDKKVPCERTSYWLEIKALKAGGNNRTRKNLIRYFSGAKVDHSGGVIVEYTLYDKTGAIAYSDKYSYYDGYVEPKKITGLKDRVP